MNISKAIRWPLCLASALLTACSGAEHDHDDGHSHHANSSAEFIAHAAVMVESGPTKILFDPIFDKDYGSFQLVAQETQQLMMSGQAPFDGVDAVFVSHAHGDHFAHCVTVPIQQSIGGVGITVANSVEKFLRRFAFWPESHISFRDG